MGLNKKDKDIEPWRLIKCVLPQHTDHAGVMWHGAYVSWLEEARIHALSNVGLNYKEISNEGFKIKYFRDNSQKCLAGEDFDFIRKYMAKDGTTIFDPADPKTLFEEKDFYKDEVLI